MEKLKNYLGQLFENRSNCYADVDNDEVIMAMDKQQFIDTVIEYLENVRDGEISHEHCGLNKPDVSNRRELFDKFYEWLDGLSQTEYDDMSLTDKCEKFFFKT